MERELCFKIADKELYFEKTLVEYMGIPIFFLCRDETAYFLVICEDVDELNYIIVKNTRLDVYNLLNGKISMRDAILKQEKYWEVISGEEIDEDCVTEHPMSEIHCDALPEKDAKFEILTDDIKGYVEKFNDNFLRADSFEPYLKNRLIDWNLQIDVRVDAVEHRELSCFLTEKILLEEKESMPLLYGADMNVIYTERNIFFDESGDFLTEAA